MTNRLSEITFFYDQVYKAITSMKSKNSAGPDGLSLSFITNVTEGMNFPRLLIFDVSFCSGKLPNIWKTSIVTSVFKKALACDLSNCMPISLTCICCKVMESITKK